MSEATWTRTCYHCGQQFHPESLHENSIRREAEPDPGEYIAAIRETVMRAHCQIDKPTKDWHPCGCDVAVEALARLEQERGALRAYLAHVLEYGKGYFSITVAHGFSAAMETIAAGKKLRKALGLPEDIDAQVTALRTKVTSKNDHRAGK